MPKACPKDIVRHKELHRRFKFDPRFQDNTGVVEIDVSGSPGTVILIVFSLWTPLTQRNLVAKKQKLKLTCVRLRTAHALHISTKRLATFHSTKYMKCMVNLVQMVIFIFLFFGRKVSWSKGSQEAEVFYLYMKDKLT